jgi:hypothetical protein
MTIRVLDRVPAPATVDTGYPMRAVAAKIARSRPPRSMTYRHIQFDQGNQGACTVFDALTEAAAVPKPFFGEPRFRLANVLALNKWAKTDGYDWVRRNDRWVGENYEGSSLDAACKLGRALGWWDGWRWALGTPERKVNDVIMTLGYYGPVMMASTWKSKMWTPDAAGNLRYGGTDDGGHAYLLTRFSIPRQAVWTPNSWGGDGQGWIILSDLAKMFAEQAEAAVPVGRKVLPVTSVATWIESMTLP